MTNDLASKDMSPETGGYDPNQLFDHLLQLARVETDDELCQLLNVEAPLIQKIRHGKLPVGPSLLIRINEVFNINVRELRSMMGDRRTEYRLTDMQNRLRSNDPGEAGIPSSVQWT